jgi:hypothetical protein
VAAARLPFLRIDVPKQVAVGAPIELTLTVKHAHDIAGYETNLLFDTSAAHFSGLRQRQNDLKKLGRDVGPLAAVEVPYGIAVGLYSCSVDSCVSPEGARQGKGQQGNKGNGQQGGGRHNMHCPSNFKMVSTHHVHMWMKDGHMVVGNKHDRNGDGKLCAREIGHHKHVVRDKHEELVVAENVP